MDNGIFLSKAGVFSGDCGCDLHSRDHEPTQCLHYHDFYELIVYLGSRARFVMEGREYLVRRGDLVLVSMFSPHMVVPEQDGQDEYFVVAHVNPEVLMLFSTHQSSLPEIFRRGENPVHSPGEDQLPKYRKLMEEYRSVHLKNGQDILTKAIIHQLLAYAYSDCFSGQSGMGGISRDLTVVTRIINCVNERLAEKFSLRALAREINYSESYICHLFKAATGKTISGYIQEKRIEMAAGLLRRDIPIHKAAERAGFHNYSHFYKTFKRQMGCNPAEYRGRVLAEKSREPEI